MADNDFRDSRSREPIAREDVDPLAGEAGRDPLAELARLIGQRDRTNEFDRSAHYNGSVATLEAPAAGAEEAWAGDDRYAEPSQPDQYAEAADVQPRLPEAYPSDRGYAAHDRDDARAPAPPARYAEPADDDRDTYADDARGHEPQYRDDAREDRRGYEPRYREDDAPPRAVGRQPALAPESHDEGYEDDDQWDDRADDRSEFADDYEDDTSGPSRRSGLVIVLSMLGLVLIGAAGAFAYRSMFGGAILSPSLPPIIRAGGEPNKVSPSGAQPGAPAPSVAAAPAAPAAPEKLVPREEQPVPVQPPNAPPRVIATIPVAPAPAPGAATPGAAPAAPAPAAPPRLTAPATAPAPGTSTEPRKVHTVPIRPDQMGSPDTAAAPLPAPAAPAPAVRAKPTPPPAAPRSAGGNAPLSLVPGAQGAAPAPEPARPRTARAEPPSAPAPTPAPAATPAPAPPTASAPAAPTGGGYAVQVTSQRSEAEAQAAFRSLQVKYPSLLGNRYPVIHRADLGEKGTYYRAMVAPFASSEAAANWCTSFKAAGGSCLVAHN
jgi:hypothetical protein